MTAGALQIRRAQSRGLRNHMYLPFLTAALDQSQVARTVTVPVDLMPFASGDSGPRGGYSGEMEREVDVRDVEEVSGRSGTTRFVLRDGEGNEYTTFRPQI